MEGKDVWKVYNERRCFSSGYSIFNSPLYSDMRFYCKDEVILAVVNKQYFKGNVNDWFNKDIMEDISPNCHFLYMYSEDDTLERINDIFNCWKENYLHVNKKKFAFIECPWCKDLAVTGLHLPSGVNALSVDTHKCENCQRQTKQETFF